MSATKRRASDRPNLGNALFKVQVLAHRLGEAARKKWTMMAPV